MAALATPASMREHGNLPTTVTDAILNPHISKAQIELKRLLGEDLYTTIAGETATDRKTNVTIAETLMALSFAVFSINIETQGTGIVRSKGWGEARSDTMSQSELQALSDRWKMESTQILSAYIPDQNVDTDEETEDEEKGRNPVLDLGHMSMGAL